MTSRLKVYTAVLVLTGGVLVGFVLGPAFSFESEGNQTLSLGIVPNLINPERGKKYSSNDVSFTTIDRGAVSGVSSSERLAIREESNWICIWKKHAQGKTVLQVVPHVDFERNMVVAVFEGDNSGSSELVTIERVKLFKDKMVVLIGHENIGASSTKSTLRSYHIVSLPKTNLPVVFH